jgi:hypothetical protein
MLPMGENSAKQRKQRISRCFQWAETVQNSEKNEFPDASNGGKQCKTAKTVHNSENSVPVSITLSQREV